MLGDMIKESLCGTALTEQPVVSVGFFVYGSVSLLSAREG
jgi:hypothetical protein